MPKSIDRFFAPKTWATIPLVAGTVASHKSPKVTPKAIAEIFKNRENLSVSSTKSMTGHLLGAAGAIEAIFCLLAMRDSVVPPTINLNDPDNEFDLDLTPNKSKTKEVNFAMSNSFGFGGTNVSLIFKKL